jgi:hypothetical protein
MGKHIHELEYSQVGDDFSKNLWRTRCIKCTYKSHIFSSPPQSIPKPPHKVNKEE